MNVDTLENTAKEFAGNWQKFSYFSWDTKRELKNPQVYGIYYPSSRDSGILEESNHAAMIDILRRYIARGEVWEECHSHWAVGYVNAIVIKVYTTRGKITKAFETCYEIMQSLQDYPALDESDYCEREFNAYLESWDNYGLTDFCKELQKKFNLSDTTHDYMTDSINPEDIQEFYENLIPSGEYYITESSGVYLNIDYAIAACIRSTLAQFLRACHAVNTEDIAPRITWHNYQIGMFLPPRQACDN